MNKYGRFRFRKWPIYNDLREFRLRIIKEVIKILRQDNEYAIANQLERAVNSIILNIAEGVYGRTDKKVLELENYNDRCYNAETLLLRVDSAS